jgi:hypothetical protein
MTGLFDLLSATPLDAKDGCDGNAKVLLYTS